MAEHTPSTCSDTLEVIHRLQTVGSCLDLRTSVQLTCDEVSPLFDRLLSLFFAQILRNQHRRPPLPYAPDDGRSINLLRLFASVRGRGGYDLVTSSKSWGFVAEDIGLGIQAGPVTKLLFKKHLFALEIWYRMILNPIEAGEKNEGVAVHGRLWTPTKPKRETMLFENCDDHDGNANALDLPGMVDWIKSVAVRPWEASTSDTGTDTSNGKAVRADGKMKEVEVFSRTIRAKNALFASTHSGSNKRQRSSLAPDSEDSILSKHQESRKQRCSQRILRSKFNTVLGDLSLKGPSTDPFPETRANVPPWTGKIDMSNTDDQRWLGTRMWPLLTSEKKSLVQQSPHVGKGRHRNCLLGSGSLECIRFHVAEKRLHLKREIGSAFHLWRLNNMGEEVSLSWTDEEEERFKSIVVDQNKNFYEELQQGFPFKNRQTLMNYYFNVFLLRRISYQSRMTPTNIDSDDEEDNEQEEEGENDKPKFGFITSRLGENSLADKKHPLFCSQNKQCVVDDLDLYTRDHFKKILDDLAWGNFSERLNSDHI